MIGPNRARSVAPFALTARYQQKVAQSKT